MARTRNASTRLPERIQLDRQGNPISPAAAFLAPVRNMDAREVVHGPGAQEAPPARAIVGYRADPSTWGRQMTAWELAKLLDMAFRNPGDLGGGFVVRIGVDDFQGLGGDLRQHFMPVWND